jgi:hypothetical protein
VNAIELSVKQWEVWNLLDQPESAEVFAGGGAGCFLRGTIINTQSGITPIEKVRVGETVLSFCDITNKTVKRKVVKTFNHAAPPNGWKCVYLKLKNGSEIKCTESHEFYIKGNWVAIGVFARRVMEARRRNESSVLHQQHGEIANYKLEKYREAINNETSEGCSRVSQDYAQIRRKVQNNQSAQDSCTTLDRKPTSKASSESLKLRQDRQQSRKFRVGNKYRKHESQSQCWKLSQVQRKSNRYIKAKRTASEGDKREVQIERTHTQNAWSRIWRFSTNDKRRYSKALEAREINDSDIQSIEFFTHFGNVYDLNVDDTHAYTIGVDGLIVHNSGKSWLGCVRQIYRRTAYANTRGFIGRRDFTALRDSTMKTYFDILGKFGYQSDVHYRYNAQEHTVYFENGSEQHFRHMSYQPSDPDFNRFGSTEYTDAFIDEAPEVDERAAQILLSRLRYNHSAHGITKELLLTGNPTDNWIKKRYVMDEEGRLIDLPKHRKRVLFTIADNPDLAFRESYINTLELLDEYDRNRLLYGDWMSKKDVERPFAHQYDPSKHKRGCHLIDNRAIHVSFDFNLDPFAIIFSHVWIDSEGLHLHVFDEMSIDSGTLSKGIEAIKDKYGNRTHQFIITGDYSGTARQMAAADGASHYMMLKRLLRLSDAQFDIKPNPKHRNSRTDVNYLFMHGNDVRVSPSCLNLERDLRTVEVDQDEKLKKKDRSKTEQRADHLDAFRYLVNGKDIQQWIKRHQLTKK